MKQCTRLKEVTRTGNVGVSEIIVWLQKVSVRDNEVTVVEELSFPSNLGDFVYGKICRV